MYILLNSSTAVFNEYINFAEHLLSCSCSWSDVFKNGGKKLKAAGYMTINQSRYIAAFQSNALAVIYLA